MQQQNFMAQNLRFLRESAKLTQQNIQDRLQISRNTWSNWENEKSEPSLDNLFRIAHFFDINIGDLLARPLAEMEEDHIPHQNTIRLHEEEDDYQTFPSCRGCAAKEEKIKLQSQVIKAMEGQVQALKMNIAVATKRNK